MIHTEKIYDVIVVGAGHAGCEAALAAAKMGASTLLITGNLDMIAHMSCNPAIGGLGKGHLVKEIDALGGEMGKNIDATGIQFRVLNASKGPAVRSSRAQADKNLYKIRMKEILESQVNLDIKQGIVDKIITEQNKVHGIVTNHGITYSCKSIVLTTGTFLRGLMHTGETQTDGGRAGDLSAKQLSSSLIALGLTVGRLKTGTCPRVDAKTIDFSGLEQQPGDNPPQAFSFSKSSKILQKQLPCYITYTNTKTHDIIKSGISRSPLFNGQIQGTGPRYCPSIEDKVYRFADKSQHQLFLEPEGLHTNEIYVNGLSTSLPYDIQLKLLRTISGLEHAEIMRAGYAVEYDYVEPTQLNNNLETKLIQNLFHAGQINGTSGYEEAAAQGLIAGINAVLKIRSEEPLILQRDNSYIGVLIDDLVTKGTSGEPYRMFTSRAEHRLLLREDNADLRLREIGRNYHLVNDDDHRDFLKRKAEFQIVMETLHQRSVTPTPTLNNCLLQYDLTPIKKPQKLFEMVRRPELTINKLINILPEHFSSFSSFSSENIFTAEVEIKYCGYIERSKELAKQINNLSFYSIPKKFDYNSIPGLSREVIEKLESYQPNNLNEASKISGITPAAITLLSIYLRKAINSIKSIHVPHETI